MGRSFGKNKPTVEADDSAFILFAFAFTLCIAVPWALILLKKAIWNICGWYKLPVQIPCQCENCTKVKEKCKHTLKTAWLTKTFFLQVYFSINSFIDCYYSWFNMAFNSTRNSFTRIKITCFF